jgi:hypothetical protein
VAILLVDELLFTIVTHKLLDMKRCKAATAAMYALLTYSCPVLHCM